LIFPQGNTAVTLAITMPQTELNIPLHRIQDSRFLTGDSNHRPPSLEDVDEVFHLSPSADDTANIHSTWKRDLHALMEHPASGPLAFLLHIVLTFLILFSALITILETVPAFHYISPRLWFGIETTVVALFTIEYITRAIAWSGAGWLGLAKWFFCESFSDPSA
jgi:potassium voltage-gated channel Shal-related subfamily D member 2